MLLSILIFISFMSEYFGTRTTRSGSIKKSYVATRALQKFYDGEPHPIFNFNENLLNQRGAMKKEYKANILRKKGENTFLYIDFVDGVYFSPILIEATKSENPPLIFLTLSPLHATICIIHDRKLYTFGFGYNPMEIIRDVRGALKDDFTKILPFLHDFEKINGAVYSTDEYLSNPQQKSIFGWVGFLNINMVDRIERIFKSTIGVIYKGVIVGNDYYLKSHAILLLNNCRYCRASFSETMNCVTFAQYVLGIRLNCGLFNNPSVCSFINKEEFEELSISYNSEIFKDVVSEIQKRLKCDLCTRMTQTLGLTKRFGGSRKNNHNVRSHQGFLKIKENL